jgi:sugar O-acyltransferase (sialic acid O-acetyltransferase NeuD family)
VLKRARRKPGIFVYGVSGHGRVVIDIVESQGRFDVACLVDDDPASKDRRVFDYRVIGGKDALISARKRSGVRRGIVAIGDNAAREAVVNWLALNGFSFITAVHPSAVIGRGVVIGAGTAVMAGAVINTGAVVGEHSIINTAATVDHDCNVGDFVHVAPGAHLCGSVVVGRGSCLCAGVTVIPNRSIGANALIGAGSTVLDDVPGGVTAAGTPAEVLKKKRWRT